MQQSLVRISGLDGGYEKPPHLALDEGKLEGGLSPGLHGVQKLPITQRSPSAKIVICETVLCRVAEPMQTGLRPATGQCPACAGRW